MVSASDAIVRFLVLAGTWRCVHGQDTSLSCCLSSRKCITPALTLRWTNIPSRERGGGK